MADERRGRLAGKRALVTAAGQGIGRATAELFVREGASVIAVDLNAAALATLSGCQTRVIDLLDGTAIAALAADIGPVDILFNCAGYVDAGALLETGEAGFDLSFDLNVRSTTRMIAAFLPAMIARGGGSIVNMASVAGAMIGVANRYAYCASKAAVAGLTRSIAVDYVAQGIRCNAICPGTVQSPSLDARLAATGDADAARAAFIARQPMGRIGRPEEVAALALYLASDESAYTTGGLHAIDGGWTMA
ncbi:SDR family oxidoreductase [Sphingomonas yantingensis]|jgi:2-keto-3-deoxy-L-fuconate dehydrogenase|uniref:2-keto-3-deoxy-L-fuconate dehydrogenase n=1 Tax=Sphingomonas yantingensis TaxID=1241761 RepID=A0A7W9APA5_9SPHN|nr:SDR family oxidoreductase [Sphingomonas yantingensis]MBB5698120.1 2-keto-3-deoxy-L-fuconate dehydrogenase [Sphingomonas yantingensis]